MSARPDLDRLEELLIKEASEPLEAGEQAELTRLLGLDPAGRRDFERVVASLSLASAAPVVPLPEPVARRLQAVGEAYVGGVTPLPARNPTPARSRRQRDELGWYAAAASLLLAVIAWYPRFAHHEAATVVASVGAEQVAAARSALLARPGLVQTALAGTDDPASAAIEGDVVWDPATQQGYLRLHGLPANNPAETQYQLWVFDAGRDQKYPVDGGVFDVANAAHDTIVPIRVPLKVGQVILFAVTVERPGGVVVSSREHIVATAKPTTA